MKRLSKERLEYLLAIMEKNSIEYSIVNNSYEIRLIPEIQQACKQIKALLIQTSAHREICHLCHEVSRVGFWVPNRIWEASVHQSQLNDILCLRCFCRLADERGVEWDKNIIFNPVSWITHQYQPTEVEKKEGDDE